MESADLISDYAAAKVASGDWTGRDESMFRRKRKKKMSKKKVKREKFEVLPIRGTPAWAMRQVGRSRDGELNGDLGHYDTKAEALRDAVKYAKSRAPSQLFIKGRNGKILDERTYGNDPRRTKG